MYSARDDRVHAANFQLRRSVGESVQFVGIAEDRPEPDASNGFGNDQRYLRWQPNLRAQRMAKGWSVRQVLQAMDTIDRFEANTQGAHA